MLKTFNNACLAFALGFILLTAAETNWARESTDELAVIYTCDSGNQIGVRYRNTDDKSTALLSWNGNSTKLQRIRAASGAKYRNDALTWWEKGGTGLLMQNDRTVERDCKAGS